MRTAVLSPPPASPSSPGGSETWGEQFDLPIRHADPRPYCGAKEKTTKATACCALSRAAGLYRTRRQIKATLEYEGALLEAAEGEQCVATPTAHPLSVSKGGPGGVKVL